MLGGGDAILGALPDCPGSASDWLIFICVTISFWTCFTKFHSKTTLANTLPISFCVAGHNTHLIRRSFFSVLYVIVGFLSGSGPFPLNLPHFFFPIQDSSQLF